MQVCIFCPGYTEQCANLGKAEVGKQIISLVQKAVPFGFRFHAESDQEALQDHQLDTLCSKDRRGHACLNET